MLFLVGVEHELIVVIGEGIPVIIVRHLGIDIKHAGIYVNVSLIGGRSILRDIWNSGHSCHIVRRIR